MAYLLLHFPEPLYIQYDGTWEEMDALITCIRSGLSDPLRKYAVFSEEGFPEQTNLIFSTSSRDDGRRKCGQKYPPPVGAEVSNACTAIRSARRAARGYGSEMDSWAVTTFQYGIGI